MDQSNPPEQITPKLTKPRIIKNLMLISLSFFLLFTAYDGLSMLQSTMNKKAGIGVISQAVGFISFCISSLFLPKYVIKKFGCKSSLFASIILYIPFIAANFYPKWYIMIPTGVFSGMGASVLWGSQCTYFNESSFRYAKLILGEEKNSQTRDVRSNRTSVDTVFEKDFHFEITEEIALKDKPPEVRNSEERLLNHKSCGNVDEVVVSEVARNCMQYLKNSVENCNLPEARGQNSHHNLYFDQCSAESQSSKEKSLIQKRIDDSKAEESIDDGTWQNKNKVLNLDKSSNNQNSQSIFQKANTLESVTGLFFGCHGLSYYSAQICSNVISYYVLKGDDVPILDLIGGCSCGARFCNDNPWCINDDTEYISNSIRYLLTTICVVIASISALLIFLFLDPLKKAKTEDEPEEISFGLFLATIHHTKRKEQLCLVPISFFEGMLQGFYTADFTKSYIGCSWGASNVGLVSIFYGAACVISSSASGVFVKYLGRKPLFLIGQLISVIMATFLILWKPDSSSPYKFYIASIFFGTITGILWSQLLAFYGLLFKEDEEAAFASYYLWSSLGWTTSFLYSDLLCTYVKIYLLLTVSIIGTTGYFFAERSYELKTKQGNIALT